MIIEFRIFISRFFNFNLGSIFSNFLNYITNSPQPARDGEIARRFKRITTDDDFINDQEPIGPNSNLNNNRGEGQFKRSAEEIELEEILQHGDSQRVKYIKTRSADEQPSSQHESVLLERSAVLKENNVPKQKKEAPISSKYPKINSREEKEMSSIKTISSLTIPKNSKKDGDQSSGEEDESSALTDGKKIYFLKTKPIINVKHGCIDFICRD